MVPAANGSEWEPFGTKKFLLKVQKMTLIIRAMTLTITKTKEPDEIVCMCVNSNLSEFPSGQTG